jgi:L,D-transpeptidase ErfK/SrfK
VVVSPGGPRWCGFDVLALRIGFGAFLFAACSARAEIFPLQSNQDLVGSPSETRAAHEDTLSDIARIHHLGFDEIVAANPGVDAWIPGEGRMVKLPTERILPNAPRNAIVVNLPEGRLYYFRKDDKKHPIVETYPISVGQMDWNTPLGVTQIVAKQKKPIWYPPKSVRDKHLADGDVLPPFIPPGPDNPLGDYALRLGIPGGSYLIHGTNKPIGVGMQVTHGCIRLYPEDIETLFGEVPVGMAVRIVNQRVKTGWNNGVLYLEVHPPLEGSDLKVENDLTALTRAVVAATSRRQVIVDWDTAERLFREARGEPQRISINRWVEPTKAVPKSARKRNVAASRGVLGSG